MGISVASTIAPYTGRGEPFTVIKGQFALGLFRPMNAREVHLAPRVQLIDLATADAGRSFTISIKGRTGLPDYVCPEPLSRIVSLGLSSADPNLDYSSAVRLVSETGGSYEFGQDEAYTSGAEYRAHLDHPNLGSLVASDVQIILHGRLKYLRPGHLNATDWQGILAGYYGAEIPSEYLNYKYWPDGNGWRTTEIHVFDNPQLRVSSGYEDRLFWDC